MTNYQKYIKRMALDAAESIEHIGEAYEGFEGWFSEPVVRTKEDVAKVFELIAKMIRNPEYDFNEEDEKRIANELAEREVNDCIFIK